MFGGNAISNGLANANAINGAAEAHGAASSTADHGDAVANGVATATSGTSPSMGTPPILFPKSTEQPEQCPPCECPSGRTSDHPCECRNPQPDRTPPDEQPSWQ